MDDEDRLLACLLAFIAVMLAMMVCRTVMGLEV